MADKKTSTSNQSQLMSDYQTRIRAELKKELGLKNINQVPKLQKITLNIGLGKAKDDKRTKEIAFNTLRKITGQQPVETMAKKSIATFKIRAGQNKIGMKVTLRGTRMYEFLEKLIHIVLPRLRDFHGVKPKAFDEDGNYSLGIKEQSVFPELEFEDTVVLHGLQINFVFSGGKAEYSKALLSAFGMPFEKEKK